MTTHTDPRAADPRPATPVFVRVTEDRTAAPVESLGLDGFETGVLAVLRHVCLSFAAPEGQSWRHAFAIATERWGPARGPEVVTGLLPVLDALAETRRAPFAVMDPLSLAARGRVTADEAGLMRLIAAMRRERTGAVRGEIAALAEGRADPGLIAASLGFAARHRAAEGQAARAPAPIRVLH